jgi:hypothetical protein
LVVVDSGAFVGVAERFTGLSSANNSRGVAMGIVRPFYFWM